MFQSIFKACFCQANKLPPTGHGTILPGRFYPSTYIQSLVKNRQIAADMCLAKRWQFFTMAFILCVSSSACLFRLLTCQNRNHSLWQQYSVQYNEIPLVTGAFGNYHNKSKHRDLSWFPSSTRKHSHFAIPTIHSVYNLLQPAEGTGQSVILCFGRYSKTSSYCFRAFTFVRYRLTKLAKTAST